MLSDKAQAERPTIFKIAKDTIPIIKPFIDPIKDCLPITLDVDYIVKSTKFIEKQKKLRYSERSYDRFSYFSSKVGQKQ